MGGGREENPWWEEWWTSIGLSMREWTLEVETCHSISGQDDWGWELSCIM